jgi:photosystem II stability/assembly factor-like uncharacterized protein
MYPIVAAPGRNRTMTVYGTNPCLIAGALLALGPEQALAQLPALTEQASGVAVTLQAVSPVDDSTAWVGGHGGVILRTVDGGRTWVRLKSPGGDSLQFRDVYAVSRDSAYVLSAGPGARSRIYRTVDGGVTWRLQFLNRDSSAFYDCFDFWNTAHGIALSDAVGGRLVLIATSDGGTTWIPLPSQESPEAAPGEGGFAASGTCLVTARSAYVWITTGSQGLGKVYRSTDRGQQWSSVTLPLASGSPTAGAMTLAFRDTLHGVALGGDLGAPDAYRDNVARTDDGGRTWTLGGRPPFGGPVFGSAYVPARDPPALVAVGPGGSASSRDDGRTWTALSAQGYWAVGAARSVAWMVGPAGRITRADF